MEMVEGLTPEELTAIREEKTNKWKQPWQVYYIAIISSMAAVVQGMEWVILRDGGSTQLKRCSQRIRRQWCPSVLLQPVWDR